MLKRKIYSVPDIAIGMKVHQATVRRWLKSGRLGGHRRLHGYMVTDAEFRAFIGEEIYEAIIEQREEI